jgi:hypothetical protein
LKLEFQSWFFFGQKCDTFQPMQRTGIFLLLLITALLSPSAQAVLMRPLGVEDLARKADLIVQGTVLDKVSLRDEAGRIYTKVNVRVAEVWKGALPTNGTPGMLTIVQSGGTVGDAREEVSGEVQYDVGEEFVAFLVFNSRGEPVTIGLAQGKFHVWRDRQSGEKFARNPFHGGPEPSEAGAAQTRPSLRLQDLKQQAQQTPP